MDTNNFKYLTDSEVAEFLLSRGESENVIPALFHLIPLHCSEICNLDYRRLDMLIDKFQSNAADQKVLLTEIISLFRSVLSGEHTDRQPYVEKIQKYINDHLCKEVSIAQIADELQISYHYMCHLFKDVTSKTVNTYRTEQRIRKAKRMLLTIWHISRRSLRSLPGCRLLIFVPHKRILLTFPIIEKKTIRLQKCFLLSDLLRAGLT